MSATIALRIVRIALYVYGGNDYESFYFSIMRVVAVPPLQGIPHLQIEVYGTHE